MKKKYHETIKNIPQLAEMLDTCPDFIFADNIKELFSLACGSPDNDFFEVKYDIPEKGEFTEATVARVRNVIAVNYSTIPSKAHIKIKNKNYGSSYWIFKDLFTNKEYRYLGKDLEDHGLFVQLEPWKSHIFQFKKV